MIQFLSLFFFLMISFGYHSQCYTGSIGVSGTGCGCLSGCNLTSLGGPNCSPAVSGNCTSGAQNMNVSIFVPNGCTLTVTASMQTRTGCSASGADAGDNMKVDILGGVKVLQTGASNASLNDSYTTSGPNTVVVSGRADRADEIITYNITSASCSNCFVILPVELLEFSGEKNGIDNDLYWTILSERNNDYFNVEKSTDGIYWESFSKINGRGDANELFVYHTVDYNAPKMTNYYRLSQTDYNGTIRYLEIIAIDNSVEEKTVIRTTNILGQDVDEEFTGLVIEVYSDYTTKKVIRQR